MTCKDVMTDNPECCVPSDAVSRAAEIMMYEDVGPVPVVRDRSSRTLVGLITDRDIAVKVVAAGMDPRLTNVGDVMSKDLVTCRVTDDYSNALHAMARHQVRRIPILNDDGSLAGIISQADIARQSSEKELGEVVEEISEPAGLNHAIGFWSSPLRSPAQESSAVAANILLTGAAFLTLGAGMMYVLDPARGRTRRAKLLDKAASLYNDSAYYAGKIQRDLQNRATGALAGAKAKLKHEEEELPDQKLEARVRTSLGRATSHAHAIRVRAENGCVVLEGNVLATERRHVLSSVRSVPGVKEVKNNLRAHAAAENFPDLQRGMQRQRQRFEFMQSHWSPTTRLLASAIGGGLILYGMRSRTPRGETTAAY